MSGVEAVDASELRPDATSAGLAADVPREELLDALTCPISGKLFVDPVTAVCGHTFSRRMLAKWMSQPGRQSSCPTCRAPLYHESPHQWPVNTTLADLCERFLNDALREARDSEPKLDFPPFDSQYRGGGGARDASLTSRETRNRERGRTTHTGRREARVVETLDDRDRVARRAKTREDARESAHRIAMRRRVANARDRARAIGRSRALARRTIGSGFRDRRAASTAARRDR